MRYLSPSGAKLSNLWDDLPAARSAGWPYASKFGLSIAGWGRGLSFFDQRSRLRIGLARSAAQDLFVQPLLRRGEVLL